MRHLLALAAIASAIVLAQTPGPRPTVIDPGQVRGGLPSGAFTMPAGFNVSIPTFAAPDVFVVADGTQPQNFTARGVPAGALYVFRNGVLQTQNTDFVPSYSKGYVISFPPGMLDTGDTIALVYQVMQTTWVALPLPAPTTATPAK